MICVGCISRSQSRSETQVKLQKMWIPTGADPCKLGAVELMDIFERYRMLEEVMVLEELDAEPSDHRPRLSRLEEGWGASCACGS